MWSYCGEKSECAEKTPQTDRHGVEVIELYCFMHIPTYRRVNLLGHSSRAGNHNALSITSLCKNELISHLIFKHHAAKFLNIFDSLWENLRSYYINVCICKDKLKRQVTVRVHVLCCMRSLSEKGVGS